MLRDHYVWSSHKYARRFKAGALFLHHSHSVLSPAVVLWYRKRIYAVPLPVYIIVKIEIMSHNNITSISMVFSLKVQNKNWWRSRKEGYSRNILQWSKKDFKNQKSTNGDYYFWLNNYDKCFQKFFRRWGLFTWPNQDDRMNMTESG